MALAQITRHGLVSIAILVAILWGCILTERRILRHAKMDTYRALRDLRYLRFKRHVEPVVQPSTMPAAPSVGPAVG
jgi:hypothetical protein